MTELTERTRLTTAPPISDRADASRPTPSPDVVGGRGAFGAEARRREDRAHLEGRGRFTDDVAAAAGAVTMAVVRSPHAHARIIRVDTEAARSAPGVIGVFTAEDFSDIGPLRPNWVFPGMAVPDHLVLADGVARFHGEAVAVVLAEDAAVAADAAEAVKVTYEPLPAVTDPRRAAEPGAALVHPDLPNGNVAHHLPLRAGNYAKARQKAAVVVSRRLRNQNLVPGALEPRSVLAEYDPASDEVVVHSSTQAPHAIKRQLSNVLGLAEHRLRVVAPHVGGGFGAKLHLYPEEVLVTALALRLRRAVRWTATRTEDFLTTNHGRDHVQHVEICATADGVITGLKADIHGNVGAYLSGMGVGIPLANCAIMAQGVYPIKNMEIDAYSTYTHTSRVDTYRGAGRPEATYLIERMVDHLARELGMDPAEIRRKNFLQPKDFPHSVPYKGFPYDSGDYEAALQRALELADYPGLRERQAQLRAQGRYLGIGLATYTEFTGIGVGKELAMLGFDFGGWEYARIHVHPTGAVTVQTGTADQGQGHYTSYAQIAAETLQLPLDQIAVTEGDTGTVPFGLGTFNSRSMATGGSAVHECAKKIVAKATRIAAHAMNVRPRDIEYSDGVFRIRKGVRPVAAAHHLAKRSARSALAKLISSVTIYTKPSTGMGRESMTWAEIARLAHFVGVYPKGLEPGLDEDIFYVPKGMVYPFGAYLAVVEVDVETGDITIDRMIAVDDCGRIINPLLARGQVHGGIAQGLGQALMEGAAYAADGRLATMNWMNYPFPRAAAIPHMQTDHTVTLTKINELSVKGIGEAGSIGAPPALVNAVLDALAPLGVDHLDMPLLPEHVKAAIRAGGDVR